MDNKILIIEDEPHLAFSLKLNLEQEGYSVVHAATGPEALRLYEEEGPFNLIILDVMLPEIDGFCVAQKIRNQDDQTGILMLTARAAEEDRLRGFAVGVDDFITKPFHLQELLARVRRMIKRAGYLQTTQLSSSDKMAFGDFVLQSDKLLLATPGGEHELTKLEANMLRELILNKGRVLTREYLLEKVWGVSGGVETRTVDNFVMRLRKMIEDNPADPQVLVSIRGRGYCLKV